MKKIRLRGFSVGQRLLLLTVLPLFVITTLLTSYMVITRQVDREDVLSDRGNSMSRYLAGAAEFGLFAGDFVTLRRLANAMLKQDDVRSVRFFDAQSGLLLAVGGRADAALINMDRTVAVARDNLLWTFQVPVYYAELDVDEFDVAVGDGSNDYGLLLGWVQLIMDEQRMRLEQQSILMTSLGMAVAGFLILFLLARYVARGISRPITKLTQTVRALEDGQLSERSKITGKGELGELAHGINSLAASVEVSSEELNSRVEEATEQLTGALSALEVRHEELESVREDLLGASAAKGDFLARMSHELRTPLTAVSGYAKLLQSMSLTDSQEEYLRNITGASQILLSTIDDILDFTRLESGVVTIEKLPFCLEDALEDVLAMHSLTAHQKQLELVLLIDPDVPLTLNGDALRLRQVLTNLVSNALKFTDEGQVVINVRLESLWDQNLVLHFSVQDSGIGIGEQHQAQLFDAFSQADQTITRRFGGTGLGLAIAKELTRLMGGDINISSQLGKGTDVNFTVSCEVVEQTLTGVEQVETAGFKRVERLYIYEQNIWMRRFLRNLGIAAADYVSVSENQQQLLANLESSESSDDVLILGFGEDELMAMRRSKLLSHVREYFSGPIVLLAGIAMTEVNALEDECARFGPLFVRSKPIRRSKLQHVLSLTQSYKENARQETAFDLSSMSGGDRLDGAKILIAEDNDFNRNLICAVVEAEGGIAIGAKDGVEALRELHARAIDLVLMDLNMPRLDGRLAVQELRRSDTAIATIPVIALTAEVLEGDDHTLLSEGFDQVLFKPLDEVRLINTIATLLRGAPDKSERISPVINCAKQSFLSTLPEDLLDEEVSRQLGLLKAAHGQQDMDTMLDQAHQLRSVLYGMADSDEVVVTVRKLELACGRGDIKEITEVFFKLEKKLSQSLGR